MYTLYRFTLNCAYVLSIVLFSLNPFTVTAKTKTQLTVYTYESFVGEWGPGPQLKKDFEAECQCELIFKAFGDGAALLTHLRVKKEQTQADVIMGLDNNLLFDALNTKALIPHTIDTSSLTLPIKDRIDIFLPYDYGYFSFIYNSEKLPHPPTSFEELVQNKNIRFIMQDPRSSTPGLGLLTTVKKTFDTQAADMWKKLSQQIVTVAPGWSEAYTLFLKGEAEMVWSYITSQAYHESIGEGKKYKAAIFNTGNYIQVENVAITKASLKRNFALAKKFMQFLLTDKAQAIIAQSNWMHSVTDYNEKLPIYFQNLPKASHTLYYKSQTVSENKTLWIEEWQNAMVE